MNADAMTTDRLVALVGVMFLSWYLLPSIFYIATICVVVKMHGKSSDVVWKCLLAIAQVIVNEDQVSVQIPTPVPTQRPSAATAAAAIAPVTDPVAVSTPLVAAEPNIATATAAAAAAAAPISQIATTTAVPWLDGIMNMIKTR